MALYVDIGISAVLVLALVIGAIRGFAKQFNGLLCALVEIAGSIGLALLIVPALQNAGTLNGLSATAAGWFKGEQFTATILSEADLQEALSQGFLKILTGLSPQIWAKMEANGMTTLGMYVGNLCANLIVGAVVWIALLLIIKLIFGIIKKLLLKLAKLPVLRVFDRIFGALWSLVIAYVIVVCIVLTVAEIVIIKFGGEGLQNTMMQIVNESTVFKFIHDTNLIGEYIANLFNVDLSSLSVYA